MRADSYLTLNGFVESRTRAARLITEGKVMVDGRLLSKPSEEIFGEGHDVNIIENERYVSRGGLKLEAAISAFGIDVSGKRCIDIGASTGGFTDCLLQNGAESVYCIDSGRGQLHEKISSNSRCRNYEGYNARELSSDELGHFDIAVMDVSFISQTLIHPALCGVLTEGSVFISLIKPQFEAGKKALSKKGIVREAKDRETAILRVLESAELNGLEFSGIIKSPIEGGDGNREYLACFKKTTSNNKKSVNKREISEISKN